MGTKELTHITWPDGDQTWHFIDKYRGRVYHREDGPAFIIDGQSFYYLDGLNYSFKNYCEKLKLPGEDILLLKLIYGN